MRNDAKGIIGGDSGLNLGPDAVPGAIKFNGDNRFGDSGGFGSGGEGKCGGDSNGFGGLGGNGGFGGGGGYFGGNSGFGGGLGGDDGHGGGAGFGGAVFTKAGTLTFKTVSFVNSSAMAGVGDFGASQGKGAAIFICTEKEDDSCSATVSKDSCGITFNDSIACSLQPTHKGNVSTCTTTRNPSCSTTLNEVACDYTYNGLTACHIKENVVFCGLIFSGSTTANALTTDMDNANTFNVSKNNLSTPCRLGSQEVGIYNLVSSTNQDYTSFAKITNVTNRSIDVIVKLYDEGGQMLGGPKSYTLNAGQTINSNAQDLESLFNITPWLGNAWLQLKAIPNSLRVMNLLRNPDSTLTRLNLSSQNTLYNIHNKNNAYGYDAFLMFINTSERTLTDITGTLYAPSGQVVGNAKTLLLPEIVPKAIQVLTSELLEQRVGNNAWSGRAWLERNPPQPDLQLINLLESKTGTFNNMSAVSADNTLTIPCTICQVALTLKIKPSFVLLTLPQQRCRYAERYLIKQDKH